MADVGSQAAELPGGRRDKVVRLLEYFESLVRSRAVVTKDLDDHLAVLPLTGYQSVAPKLDTGVKPGGVLLSVSTAAPDEAFRAAHVRLLRVFDELSEHSEAVELVLASGLLTAPARDGRVRGYLLTQPVTLQRDRRGKRVYVTLPKDSAPRIEDSVLLAGLPGFDLTSTFELRSELRVGVRTVVDPACADLVQRWFSPAATAAGGHLDHAPALILRARGASPLLAFYRAMIGSIAEGERPVPPLLAQLVDAIDRDERLDLLREGGALSPGELLEGAAYVLPSNVEQRDILTDLGTDSGVVVEGPPGTGKTHTIANLLTVLLAKGQRVLVVSEKAHALAVLEDKLPPELRELVVSVVDVTRDGAQSLAGSVAEIATRKSTFSEPLAEAELKDLRAKLERAVAVREELVREVWRLRTAESEDAGWVSAGYSGKPAEIVTAVHDGAERFSWLPGPVDGAVPPLDTREFDRLVQLLRRDDSWFAHRLKHNLPDLDVEVPELDQVESWCAEDAAAQAGRPPQRGNPVPEFLNAAPPARQAQVREEAGVVADLIGRVRRLPPSAQLLADDLLIGDRAHLAARLPDLDGVLAAARQDDMVLAGVEVVFSVEPTAPVRAALTRYVDYLTAGGAARKRFRRSEQKEFEETGVSVTVGGRAAAGAQAHHAAVLHLAVEDAIGAVGRVLAGLGLDAPAADPRGGAGGRSERLSVAADQVLRAQLVVELVTARDRLASLVGRGAPYPRDVHDLQFLVESIGAAGVATDVRAVDARFDAVRARIEEIVAQGPSPEGDGLIGALRQRRYPVIRDARRAWDAARMEKSDRGALDLLALRLRTKAPMLLNLLARSAHDPQWDVRTGDFTAAWAWRRAAMWLSERVRPDLDERLDGELKAAEEDVAHYRTLVATAEAWRACLRRMSFDEVQALHAYRDAVASVGRGSGRHAERFRVAARDAMRRAQTAVPAWVMPIAQAVATVPAEPDVFDVVIVDEASQADITSVFLLWLAPRVIVVGDENQCAPATFSGLALGDVFARLDARLPDVPEYLRANLTPRSSMFTLLRARFGRTVRLREHFRCVPEIIDFSSRQFYPDAPLIPVRHVGADRPRALQFTFVPDAEVVGEGMRLANPVEAAAIADTIAACVIDPAYAGRTFGVIVLQGQGQVEVLYALLRERIDPDEFDARRIRVGTPPDFQGDERDVVMLSMVVAPGYRTRALTSRDLQRRFNVAASRARDQMWLFSSMPLDQLREHDLRWSLMSYIVTADTAPVPSMPVRVPTDRRVEPFDSLFEQQVFRRLADMGYHVNPKVTVNRRVVDMVVTGSRAKLAVECDSADFVSTPEQARSDIERERELRRCGWEFVRVRESIFRTDPDAAMTVVLGALQRRGVLPLEIQPALVAAERPLEVGQWNPIGLDIDTD